jgi:hypothetical protein
MRYLLLAGLVVVIGCGKSEASPSRPATAVAPARQYIVGIDLSASRTPTQLADGERLLKEIVGDLQPGDRLVLIQTYQAARDDALRWEMEMPRLREPGNPTGGEKRRLDEERASALAVVPAFFDVKKSESILSTDILQTLFRAADYAKARPRDSTIVLLLSDMLNSTGEMDMERAGGVPGSEWIAARKAEGRLPDLRGVCVFAVGADVASRRGAQARAFWGEFMRQSGAVMPERAYRSLVTKAAEVGC